MKSNLYFLTILSAVGLLGASCTERRTASEPAPDGDTVRVVIPDQDNHRNTEIPEIINVPDSIDLIGH